MPELASCKQNLHSRNRRQRPPMPGHADIGPARQPAPSQLMGRSGSLAMPSLEGVAVAHRYSGGDRLTLDLARALVELDIGAPEDWETAAYDPTSLIEATLGRWIEDHGGEAIRHRFDLTATICSFLDEYSERRDGSPASGRLYLTVESDAAAYLVLGPVLRLLEQECPGLAASFFETFTSALNRWLRVYDYRDAQDRVQMWREWMEEDGGQGQYEIPDVEGCIPECLKRKRLGRSEMAKLGSRIKRTEARKLVTGVVDMAKAAESAERPELTEETSEQLCDTNPPLPGLMAVFSENDAVEGCFDEDMQNAFECMPEPSLIIPFDVRDLGSIRGAFEIFGVACRTIALASSLMDLMPGNERWVRESAREERP